MVLCPSLNSCLIFLLGHGFKRVQTGSAQSSASLARHDMQFFCLHVPPKTMQSVSEFSTMVKGIGVFLMDYFMKTQ